MTYQKNTTDPIPTKICNKCFVTKLITRFHKHRGFAGGRHGTCADCINTQEREKWANQSDEKRAKRNAKIDEYAKAHPEIKRASTKKWRQTNPEKIRKNQDASRDAHLKIRRKVIDYYSNGTNKCACCGESQFEFLVIDHTHGGGGKHRKEHKLSGSTRLAYWLQREGFPDGFRILCHNCNMCLGAYGYCPHTSPELSPETVRPRRIKYEIQQPLLLGDSS